MHITTVPTGRVYTSNELFDHYQTFGDPTTKITDYARIEHAQVWKLTRQIHSCIYTLEGDGTAHKGLWLIRDVKDAKQLDDYICVQGWVNAMEDYADILHINSCNTKGIELTSRKATLIYPKTEICGCDIIARPDRFIVQTPSTKE